MEELISLPTPRAPNAQDLISSCRGTFSKYGAPEELSSDNGPQFTAYAFEAFMRTWGITPRRSAPYFPQSNRRAELAVKAAKRIIYDNVKADGSLDTDKAHRALLQYRNTPLPGVLLSPAQILFHRRLRDFVPAHKSHYLLNKSWLIQAKSREAQFTTSYEKAKRYYDVHKQNLPSLALGTSVAIQDVSRRGRHLWNRYGRIVDVKPHKQYAIRMEGSGRVLTRNRKHLRPIVPLVYTPFRISPPVHENVSVPPSHIDNDRTTSPLLTNASTPLNASDTDLLGSSFQDLPAMTNHSVPGHRTGVNHPLALRRLDNYNKPGLMEAPLPGYTT